MSSSMWWKGFQKAKGGTHPSSPLLLQQTKMKKIMETKTKLNLSSGFYHHSPGKIWGYEYTMLTYILQVGCWQWWRRSDQRRRSLRGWTESQSEKDQGGFNAALSIGWIEGIGMGTGKNHDHRCTNAMIQNQSSHRLTHNGKENAEEATSKSIGGNVPVTFST